MSARAVPLQLHLEPDDFVAAITALQRTGSELDGSSSESEWHDVRVIEDPYVHPLLRISRHLDDKRFGPVAGESSPDATMESTGIAEEDDDEEALVRSPRKKEQRPVVVYDIVYSPSYRVPVLYLILKHAPGANIYELLVPISSQPQMQHTGLSGALSLTDHPVTGLPVYFVHPCRTAEAMAAVRGVSSEGPVEYLMLWFGLVGSSVGLAVPVALAEALQNER